jgi:hypothetical protein
LGRETLAVLGQSDIQISSVNSEISQPIHTGTSGFMPRSGIEPQKVSDFMQSDAYTNLGDWIARAVQKELYSPQPIQC